MRGNTGAQMGQEQYQTRADLVANADVDEWLTLLLLTLPNATVQHRRCASTSSRSFPFLRLPVPQVFKCVVRLILLEQKTVDHFVDLDV